MIKRVIWITFVLGLVSAPLASAQSFFTNYLKPEYMVPVGDFPSTSGGDRNLVYYQVQIPILKGGELLLLGEFPRGRYFSITAYDDHGAVVGVLNDQDIQPYGSTVNPYQIGVPFGTEDVLYAVTVRLGDGLALSPVPQCAPPLGVHTNLLDVRSRHTAGTFYSAQQSHFSANVSGLGTVVHDDTPANSGAFLLIRTYLRQNPAPNSQFDLRKPLVWVRQSSSGCAAQIAPVGQMLPISQWFSLNSILKLDQALGHVQHEVDLGVQDPAGPNPLTQAPWFGREEYLPGQAIGRYLATVLPIDTSGYANAAAALNGQGRVMEMQFRLPKMPCHVGPPCGLTGAEDLRYWSVTFEDANGTSLATLSDVSMLPDANGYVTLVVSFGTALPPQVTAANGYTTIVWPAIPMYRAVLRNYLPGATFFCSTSNVPPRTAEYTATGGYMGEYAPVVTFPLASTLTAPAQPLIQFSSCEAE